MTGKHTQGAAFYNEIDPFAAAWSRELIKDGAITGGVVDERSIADLEAEDLAGYDRVHLFAGIGGWDYALRLAGFPATRPVWTGSCPCQPFSVAGKGRGADDERHLWPEMRRLIEKQRPATVIGEQVDSPAGRRWLARVQADMEALGYAVGRASLCSAGVGAPGIRSRLFWVAYSDSERRRERRERDGLEATGQQAPPWDDSRGRSADGPWANTRTLEFTDGKRRRIESSLEPLVAGLPKGVVRGGDPGEPFDANATAEARVGRLRGYGNSIVPQLAATFIRAFLETEAP